MDNKQPPCRFEDNIMEMYGDVKAMKANIDWLAEDAKIRNSKFETHMKEGEQYRDKVIKNTSAVFFIKWVIGFLMVMVMVVLRLHLTQ